MSETCASRDLVCTRWAWLLWCLPTILLVVGFNWPVGRPWLWIPALLLAGSGCIANAGRCGRLHCYATGPFFLLATVYVALAEFHIVPLEPRDFLLVLIVVTAAAYLAEFPLGRYARKAESTR